MFYIDIYKKSDYLARDCYLIDDFRSNFERHCNELKQ